MATEIGLRERKKQKTRQLLSDTARRLFSEQGFENVSVADVARAAEVSPATVFNYFPTKEDLVYSGLETFEEQMLTTIRERPRGQTVVDAFRDFILTARGFLAAEDEATAGELVVVTGTLPWRPASFPRAQQNSPRYKE